MAQVINSNVASLNAQRNLSTSQSALATSLQRLSSGLRINSAKDDAAGLAISDRMTAQIRGLNQAARNANDGISLAQTAEGSLAAIGENLQRMREIAVQASNATNTSVDGASLDTEFQELSHEIDRVADQTSFNGKKLLDGSFAGAVFQVGANAGESITLANITDANTASLGGTYTRNTASVTATALTGYATAIVAGGVTINGKDIGAIAGAGSAAERAGQLANAINQVSQQSGVSANYDTATGSLSLVSQVAITMGGSAPAVITSGWATGAVTVVATSTTGISSQNVLGYGAAQSAIGMIDQALSSVNSTRATLGAMQNRFQSAVSNLQTASENLTASRSRIQDADFASETAAMTRGQILQQAGTAILAQANSLPNSVLSLLK